MIAKIAVATFLGEERPKVVLEGGEGVMRAFGDHLGEDARLLVRVVVERVEKRVEGNHEIVCIALLASVFVFQMRAMS